MASSVSSSSGKDTTSKGKTKRGHYGNYLSQPNAKIPKTTFYRMLNKSKSAEDNDQETLSSVMKGMDDEVIELSNHPVQLSSFLNESAEILDDSGDPTCSQGARTISQTGLSRSVEVEQPTDREELDFKAANTTLDEAQASIVDDITPWNFPDVDDPAIDMEQRQMNFAFPSHEENILDDIWSVEEEFETSDESSTETSQETDGSSLPLFEGARLTLGASMLLVITFAMRHSITGVALADLLLLIEVHLISPNCFGHSMKLIRNFFKQLKNPIEYHFYCSFCFEYIGVNKSHSGHCPNKHCLQDFTNKGSLAYFIIIPFITQLQALLARDEVYDLLQYRFTRKKKSEINIEDIFDGQLYLKHFGKDGFFKGTSAEQKQVEIHLSLQINTDGVALFNSSKFSIWPVYCLLNELPPKCRQQRRYRLFAGLWFGKKKPHFQTFMQPFAKTFKDLFNKGAKVKIGQSEKTLRCLLLFGTFDAPAKCLFQEFYQFNAFYGCPYCLSPGETVKTSKGGHTHAYPFNESNLKTGYGEERTHEQTVQFAAESTKKAAVSGVPSGVYGVKGFSWFMFVPKFDIIRGVAIDYMHGTLLGVVKMLLQLWMNKSYSSEPWSISQKLSDIESRYMNLSPPACISRLPRSLIENFSHLKASELRTFLLFYSVPCLYGILPDMYFQHFILLVEAIYLLLQDSISMSDLKKAASLLKHFCIKIKSLYDPRYETYNVHCLLHLADRVFDLGPLWTHSCFCYEDFNGELRSCFHGTQGVEEQIALAVSIQMKIPELVPLLPQGSTSKWLYDKMTKKTQEPFNKLSIDDGRQLFSVGSVNKVILSTVEKAILETLVGPVSQVFKFHRMQVGAKLIHCKEYKCMSKRNNYTVQFQDPQTCKICYGQVKYYLKCFTVCPNPSFCGKGCACQLPKHVAMVEELVQNSSVKLSKDAKTSCIVPHIIPVTVTASNLKVMFLTDITTLCIFMQCDGDSSFVGLFPNTIEKD